jgi:serine/threonine-protein kinase
MPVSQAVGSRYTRDEALGRGASGTVWRGAVVGTQDEVAVKVLHEGLANDPDVVVRFLQERSLLERVKHRNLVGVRDLVVEGDLLALVMDLIDGPDLRTYLRERGSLEPSEAAHLIAVIAEALATIHDNAIIHRDLKPANILMWNTTTGFQPMLTDFGIARLADGPEITRSQEVLGTPYYVAPETVVGEASGTPADVYALGVVLYELVAGRPPFKNDDSFLVLRQHVQDEAQRPDGVPDELWAIIAQCMSKDPSQRPDARTLAGQLAGYVNQTGAQTGAIAYQQGQPIRPDRPPPQPPAGGNTTMAAPQPPPAQPQQAQQAQQAPAPEVPAPRTGRGTSREVLGDEESPAERTHSGPPPDMNDMAPDATQTASYESIRGQLATRHPEALEEGKKKKTKKKSGTRMPLPLRIIGFFFKLVPFKGCLFKLALLATLIAVGYNYLLNSQYRNLVDNPVVDNAIQQVQTAIQNALQNAQSGQGGGAGR